MRRPATAASFLVSAVALAVVLSTAPSSPVAAARPDRPATKRVLLVDHNIEKRPGALSKALAVAGRSGAEAITLQEVCRWQADDVMADHPGWTVAWKPERTHHKCVRDAGEDANAAAGADSAEPDPGVVGNLAIWTGGPGGATSTSTYPSQRFAGDGAGVSCVSWVDRVRFRVCSVHLISPFSPAEVKVRTHQARDLRAIAAPWIAADDVVVLGGDFNARPRRQTMTYLYRGNGRGDFVEASTGRAGPRECRCEQSTYDDRAAKIDYVFFSADRLASRTPGRTSGRAARALRGLRTVPTVSDHHLLVGWATVDVSRR